MNFINFIDKFNGRLNQVNFGPDDGWDKNRH